MLQYANQILPDWNTASEGDFGVALVELFAYAGDILSFYGDRITQEAYLPTATQRLSLLNIAQLLGYTVSNGAPATGSVVLQTTTPGSAVTVPAGTQVQTDFVSALDAPIIYQTDDSVLVPANGGTATVNVTQGVTFTGVSLGTSTGLAGQVFQIPQTGVLPSSIEVYVTTSSGTSQWSYVQYLVNSNSSAAVYTTYLDANGLMNVEFGDNLNGMIPAVGLTISASYTVIAGSSGNVAAGTVSTLTTPISGVFIPVLADGTTPNTSVMSGGADAETNDQIRAGAAASFQTQNRAVSIADFDDLVMNVPGVTAATSVSKHSTSVTIYALGPSFQAPTTTLQDNIISYFAGLTLAGVTVTVGNPGLIPIDVGSSGSTCTIQVQPQYFQSVVISNIQTALQLLFQPPTATFGQYITVGMVYQTIMSVAGVDWAIVPVMTREDVTQANTNPIQLRPSEIAVPGQFYYSASGGL
jgi:uncharacterized phage protein gp47/JayE